MPDRKTLLSFTLIFILGISLFHNALTGANLLTERDLSVFFIPPRLLWLEILRGGEFPLWNPYALLGHPLFATLQPGILYPVNILLLVLPFDLAFNWTIIIHFPLAGVFTFLLLRELKASHSGAFTGSIVLMLSGYLFSLHNVMSTLFSVTWIPLALLFFLRAVRVVSYPYAVMTGVTLAVMFLGGGIESLFACFMLLGFMAMLPSVLDIDGGAGTAAVKKRFALLAVSAAVFLILSAVQLLPFLELASQSTRAGGLQFFEATTWSFHPKDFIQFFLPDPFGYFSSDEKYWSNQSWIKTVYTGTLPFLMSVFFFRKYGKNALPFALTALFFLSLSMGRNNPVYYYLFSWAPVFNKIRYPVKFLFITVLFLSIASGLGMDSVRKAFEEKGVFQRRFVLGLVITATACACAFGLMHFYNDGIRAWLAANGVDHPGWNYAYINIFNTKRGLFFLIISALALFFSFNSARIRRFLPHALILILAVDLFFAHVGYYRFMDSEAYHRKGHVLEFLSKEQGLFRAFVTPVTNKDSLELDGNEELDQKILKSIDLNKERLMGYNLEHKVFDSGGLEVMRRGDYTGLFTLISTQPKIDSTKLLDLFNIRYIVSIPKIESPGYKLRAVLGAGGKDLAGYEDLKTIKVYENGNSLPRFFIASDWKIVKDREEYSKTFLSKSFDPGATVLLEKAPWPGQPTGKQGLGGEVEVTAYRNNSIDLKVKTDGPGILVASESWYPGWKVFVDGVEKELLRADQVLRGVPLEKGEHIVRFIYDPLSFKAGFIITGAGMIILLISGIFYGFRTKRRRQAPAL